MPGYCADMCPYYSRAGWETQHKCSLLLFLEKFVLGTQNSSYPSFLSFLVLSSSALAFIVVLRH